MHVLLLVAGLCSFSLFLAWRSRLFLAAPFFAICCTALVHLTGALTHMYAQSKVAMLLLSLLLGGYTIFRLLRTNKDHLTQIARPVLLFALLLGFFAWHYAEARLVYWDEFYWGGFAKHLVLENGLWTWDSILPRQDSTLLYPPGITILQTMFQPVGQFEEPLIALAQSALLIAACGVVLQAGLPLVHGALTKCCLILGSFVFLRVLGSKVRYFSYLFGYADAMQLAIYSSLVLMAIFMLKKTRETLFLWGCACLFLVLCKPTGLVLSGFAIGALALNQLCTNMDENDWRASLKANFVPALKTGLRLFVPCVLVWLGWQLYVRQIVLGDVQALFANMGNTALPPVLAVIASTVRAFFFKAVFAIPYILPGYYTGSNFALFLLIGVMLFYVHKSGSIKADSRILLAYLALTWVIWLVLHAYANMRYFTHIQYAHDMALGYDRFIAVVIGPALLTALILFLQAASQYAGRPCKRFLQIGLTFTAVLCIIFAGMRPHGLPDNIADMRAAATSLLKNVPEGSSYLVVTGKGEYELNNACQFYVMPTLQEAYIESSVSYDPHAMRVTRLSAGELSEDFRTIARQYKVDYLLLWHFDQHFLPKFGPMLGLNTESRAPILLDLKAWAQGEANFPQQVALQRTASQK